MTTINSSKAYPITTGDKTASLHYHTIELINNSSDVPVGSFTWWFGLYKNIPDGWLVLDGSTFNQFTYPQLYRVLGSNVLPNVLNKNTGYLYGVPTFDNKYIIPVYYQETIVNGVAYNVYNWTYPIYIILPEDELLDSFPNQKMNYFTRNTNGTYTKKENTNIGAVYYRVKKRWTISNVQYQPTYTQDGETGYLYARYNNNYNYKRDIPTVQSQIVTRRTDNVKFYVTTWSNPKYLVFTPDPYPNLYQYIAAQTVVGYFEWNTNGYYKNYLQSIGNSDIYNIKSPWTINNKRYQTSIIQGKGRFIRANNVANIYEEDTVGPGVVTNVTANNDKGYDARVDAYPVQSITVTKSTNKQTKPVNISAIPLIKALGNINNSFSYDISNYCTCITYANDINGNVYVSNATKQYNVHLIGSISNNMIYMQVIIYLAFDNGPFAPASIYLTIPYNKLGDINKNKLLIPNNSISIYISSWSNTTYPNMTPAIDYSGGDYFRVYFGGNNLTGAAENITLNISGNVS